jgi:hypothetical protein
MSDVHEGAGPITAEMLAGQETVGRWLRAYDAQWNVQQSDGETRAKLDVLARFCTESGRQPDELVTWLFRPTPEGPRIRLKRRREVMALIEEFEVGNGGRPAGNTVRSFLIHNGVAMSAPPLR